MSTRLQAHALASFVVDVLEPLQERLHDAQHERCAWRRQWSAAEALEATRFLGLGRVLGVFDPDEVARVREHHAPMLEHGIALGDAALGSYPQAMLYRLDEWLGTAPPLAAPPDDDDRRAWLRDRGLFQANVLVSSRLGHGLAAEALARLAFGDPMSCLQPLAALAGTEQAPAGMATMLADAMRSPSASMRAGLHPHAGASLAASVFHATQYMWTLGFTHEERGMAIVDGKPWPDPMVEHAGQSTAEALHLMQYWRLDLHREAFERDLLEAVDLMARIVFRHDETLGRAGLAADAEAFAHDLRTRFEQASRHWKAIFQLVTAGADQGDQGDPLQGGLARA